MEEAAAMRGAVSPSTRRRYPLTMICAVYRVPRSSLYRALAPPQVPPRPPAKRGPRTPISDAELVGWHTAKIGDRWAALEPLRQGVRHAFGRFEKDVARGLRIRCDWGPQFIADATSLSSSSAATPSGSSSDSAIGRPRPRARPSWRTDR